MKNQAGQAVLEYTLITAVLLGILLLVLGRFKQQDFFFKTFTAPIVQYLKYNYKYADAAALGWDEINSGGPRRHIEVVQPNAGNTFKIFIPHMNAQ